MSVSDPPAKLFLLGAPRVRIDGKTVSLPTQKAEALLAFLAVHETRHSRERLATLLWGNVSDKRARSSLRNALYILRDYIGEDIFLLERNYAAIKPNTFWVDFRHLEQTVSAPYADVEGLKEALALWRAPFLDGVSFSDLPSFDEWLSRERERSHLFYCAGWLRISKLLVMEGKYPQALEAARHLVSLDPFSEPAHRHLMRLHLISGDRVAALKIFDDLRSLNREGFLTTHPAPLCLGDDVVFHGAETP